MIRKYNHTDFLPLNNLIKEKKLKNISVSLVIPARNEASTIGPIVARAKQALMKEIPLLEEIIVIDGNSADNTYREARDAGARVYRANEINTQSHIPSGKGAAIWKSLFVSKGDIIACIDADISNFHPRFIYGTISPLIIHDDILFAKAFYTRPLQMGKEVIENEGGRVTEILVRPILETFYGELLGLNQPLAGEYALKRNVAESISFFSGYGVEIGMILDIYESYGISSFAQVDMAVRRHRNRPVKELGRMSLRILHSILQKLNEQNKITLNQALGSLHTSHPQTERLSIMVEKEVLLPPVKTIAGGL